MTTDGALSAALWGLGGGFIYAGMKLTVRLYALDKAGGRPGMALLEFVIALVSSAVAASAAAPFILAQGFAILGKPGAHQMPALACFVGYSFNQLGPELLAAIRGGILNAITASGGAKK